MRYIYLVQCSQGELVVCAKSRREAMAQVPDAVSCRAIGRAFRQVPSGSLTTRAMGMLSPEETR